MALAARLAELARILKPAVLDVAEAVDAWRIAPRAFVLAYVYTLHQVTGWFMALPMPTTEQAGFAGGLWAFFVPVLGWYMSTGRRWQ